MPELLLELGCEELPASFVRKAFTDLRDDVVRRLEEAGLSPKGAEATGTARRLIVRVAEVADRQQDATKEVRGPGSKAAYGPDGAPTKALEGFLRGQGATLDAVRVEGDYVWVSKHVPGRSAVEVLAELLPEAIRALSFEKSMRWGSGRMRFARPIRWLVALFGGAVVPFEVEGVRAGAESRGHRFAAPAPFPVRSYDDLIAQLRQRAVEPNHEERAQIIRAEAEKYVGPHSVSGALVEENTFLVEKPIFHIGAFPEHYLELPSAVVITAMAKHEKFFPVYSEEGRLEPKFLSVRNHGDEEIVRGGNEWVLNARLADAKFFFDEDRKVSLDDFLARTAGMSFQEKLGTVRRRADRLAELSHTLAGAVRPEWAEDLRLAGLYAKADLSCGLVGELPGLQGQIGGFYAAIEKKLSQVAAAAVAGHYDPANSSNPQASSLLQIADQLDKLAGFLGIGLAPTGSSDPYALRRAATILIESHVGPMEQLGGYAAWFDKALALYSDQGFSLDAAAARKALADLFAARYPVSGFVSDEPYDAVQAALLDDEPEALLNPSEFLLRLKCMVAAKQSPATVQTATRPLNIVAAARKKEYAFGDQLAAVGVDALDSAEGASLHRVAGQVEAALSNASSAPDVMAALEPLMAPINAFFDSTMVMVDDDRVRGARLTLLAAVGRLLRRAGDWTKLEG